MISSTIYVKRDANSGARCVAARVYNNEKLYLKVKNEVAEYLKRFFYRQMMNDWNKTYNREDFAKKIDLFDQIKTPGYSFSEQEYEAVS